MKMKKKGKEERRGRRLPTITFDELVKRIHCGVWESICEMKQHGSMDFIPLKM